MNSPCYLLYLQEFGHTSQTTHEQFECRLSDLKLKIILNPSEYKEFNLLSDVLTFPENWDYKPSYNCNTIIENIDSEQPMHSDDEIMMAKTFRGKNPKRSVFNDPGYVYNPTRGQATKERSRNEKLWSKRNLTNIDLGIELNKQFGYDHTLTDTKPVPKEGVMLYCNDPRTAEIEISSWQSAIDIAIGLNPSWNTAAKLNYIENTLGGIAKLAWNSFKNSTNYQEFSEKFALSNGAGITLADSLRFEICGKTDRETEKLENKRLALNSLHAMRCCSLNSLNEYNQAFSKFYWIIGESGKQEYLDMYFSKLPQPFGDEAKRTYNTSKGDSIGTRINHVEECLKKLCLQEQLRSQGKQSYTICKDYLPISYEFGCSSSKQKPRKHKKQKTFSKVKTWKRKRFRRPKRKSRKPKFFKKRDKHSDKKKPTDKVKCFGCQQIGHYANKCPNKPNFSSKVKAIEELGLVICDEYESDCFSETQSFYETNSDYTSSDSSSE